MPMTDALFESFCRRYGLRLSAQQAEAVRSVDRPTLLVAVPGSGKTTALVCRLGYMVRALGTDPSSILTMTYSVAATQDMKQRYIELFGDDGLQFRTINGVCSKIISYYGKISGKEPFSLLSDERRISRALAAIYKETEGTFPTEAEIKQLRTDITYAKNTALPPESIEKPGGGSYDFPALFSKYNAMLRSDRLMDYDDQMIYAAAILRKYPSVLSYYRDRFRYICVDEAQDTSKLQHSVISLLSGRDGRIFMVGDEDQSIYGFRAAYPDALVNFERDHDNARVLFLERNYRSASKIVKAADSFVKKNLYRREKNMKADRTAPGELKAIDVPNRAAQYGELFGRLKNAKGEVAVLYRDNECALPLIDLLDRGGVDFSVNIRSPEIPFFSNRLVTDVMNMLRFAADPTDTEAFSEIYYKINTYISKNQIGPICEESRRRGLSVFGAAYASGLLKGGVLANLKEVKEICSQIRQKSASEALDLLLYRLGYKQWLTDREMSTEKLPILYAIASGCGDAAEFLRRLPRLSEITEEHKNLPCRNVILSTVHSSKGLEYDTVYMLDVFDGMLPKTSSPSDGDEDGMRAYMEERRLFFVGMTRAKNALYICRIKDEPSQFCDEIFGAAKAPRPVSRQENGVLYHGARIRHAVLGDGTVLFREGGYVYVDFDRGGKKRLDEQIITKNGLIKPVN